MINCAKYGFYFPWLYLQPLLEEFSAPLRAKYRRPRPKGSVLLFLIMPGVRDEGLLQSALSSPKNLYFYGDPKSDISVMAAAYGFGISKNHSFNDGNKRTALIAIRIFLKLNGFDLTATGPEKFTMIVELASSHIDESDLSSWIRDRI